MFGEFTIFVVFILCFVFVFFCSFFFDKRTKELQYLIYIYTYIHINPWLKNKNLNSNAKYSARNYAVKKKLKCTCNVVVFFLNIKCVCLYLGLSQGSTSKIFFFFVLFLIRSRTKQSLAFFSLSWKFFFSSFVCLFFFDCEHHVYCHLCVYTNIFLCARLFFFLKLRRILQKIKRKDE